MNEVRFGGVAALQAEITRLQQEIASLKRGGTPHEGSSSACTKELSDANQACGELYCTTARLWRELCSARRVSEKLKAELELQQELVNRGYRGSTDEYAASLRRVVDALNYRSLNASVVVLERAREA